MNFRVLRYFLAVASCLSFSKAADTLHISQSTLSQQIQQLEEYYNAKFFKRMGNKISLTPAGLEFQEYASHALMLEDLAISRIAVINEGKNVKQYPLRLKLDIHMLGKTSIIEGILKAIQEMKEELDGKYFFKPSFYAVDLDNPSSQISELLDDPHMDFWAFGSETPEIKGKLDLKVLVDDSYVLMISKKHPLYKENLTLEDVSYILKHTTLYAVRNRSRFIREILNRIPGGIELHPLIRFEDMAEVISMYIALGEGVSVVPMGGIGLAPDESCVSIPIPDTHFYTLAGYAPENKNPLLPILLDKLSKYVK